MGNPLTLSGGESDFLPLPSSCKIEKSCGLNPAGKTYNGSRTEMQRPAGLNLVTASGITLLPLTFGYMGMETRSTTGVFVLQGTKPSIIVASP